MMNKENKFSFGWGDGCSDLFLLIKNSKATIMDCEFDRDAIYEMCGGETTYCSNSGCTGSIRLDKLGELIPIGGYRVDTVHNDFMWFVPVAKNIYGQEIYVAVPYASHRDDKTEIFSNYPTVIKVENSVIYCDLEGNFLDVLKDLMSCKGAQGNRKHRTLQKIFSRLGCWDEYNEHKVVMEFYNLCSMENTPNPWEFYTDELKEYSAAYESERMFQLLAVNRLKSGQFAKTIKVESSKYYGALLEGNPLETGNLTAGWQREAEDVLVRYYDKSNEVHLVAYTPYKEAHEKLARRFAYRMNEGDEFIDFVLSNNDDESHLYSEYEIVIPKALYQIDRAAQITEVRKGLARKIRQEIIFRVNQWISKVNDQTLLEVIPDDMVITIEDSLDAGNCRPGTESFIASYFPGRTQATAKELKKYSGNYNVMRIFRYLAAVGRFSYKEKRFA